MPELPDLQVFSKNLDKKLKGRKVLKLSVHSSKVKTSAKEFSKHLEGQTISGVFREGKQIHIAFKNKAVLGLHLMLHGDLHLAEEGDKLQNIVLEMIFEKGDRLVLTDWQGAAVPTLNPEPSTAPDALSEDFTPEYLRNKTKGRAAVKNILLDQKVVRGIGNAYADEILWEARIAPFSIANKIPEDKIKDLVGTIKKVLHDAEKQILRSHPDIISGEIRDFLKIHHAGKTKSPGGAPILTETRGGRKTYYTKEQVKYE